LASPSEPRVVIVGGGFGGLTAARSLRRAPVDVTLIDRRNHYLFQPLLYQVATGVLSPADIAMPLRVLLRAQRNATVLLAEVGAIDLDSRVVNAEDGRLRLPFDYLIVAPGSRHSYFTHPEWESVAPGLKTLDDAREIRRRFLLALEQAERSTDAAERDALLTFVIVGGGPTGVELAGVLPTLARQGFRRDFRRLDLNRVRVLLVEGGPRLLAAFPEHLSARALRDLRDLGVDCRTGAIVTQVTGDAVYIGEERIATRTVLWAAGNTASPLVKEMGIATDRAGRASVLPDLSIPGHPHVFVIGDAAAVPDVPGLAAAANQMGAHAARMIVRALSGQPREPFRYRDKGSMAVIGRGRAVADFGRVQFTGLFAFVTWLFVHLLYLAGFRNRLAVMLEWGYSYFTYGPSARLITEEDARARPGAHPANHGDKR
jgi:NADH:ubiquinone reductase (H+-translocating)